jgi:hypothetical protein
MADYTPEMGPKLAVDFTHGMIRREHRGVATTAGQAIVRRLSPHGSIEPGCFDHEVLLPASAPDDLRKLHRLVATYEEQQLPGQRDLLGIATVRFDHGERFHVQWECARSWARASFNARGLAVVLVQHVPALSARAHKPHLHALYFPRVLHGCFGAFVSLDRATLAAEWAAHLARGRDG